MLSSKRLVCVIPARLASTRFPKKLLIKLLNKPLLERVWEAATSVSFFDQVLFAVDDEELAQVVKGFKGNYVLTPKEIPSGADRVAYVQKMGLEKADVWVNWQADEPFIKEKMIIDLLQGVEDPTIAIWTLKKKITESKEVDNIHIAKVVTDANGCALYFSRSPIPCYRDETPWEEKVYFKHVGLYAYSNEALAKIATLPQVLSEEAEKLEQLRFLHYGLKIKVNMTLETAFGIDLPEHHAQAEEILKTLS